MDYIAYAHHVQANEKVVTWLEKNMARYFKEHTPSTQEVEHIIDYLISYSCPVKIEGMTYEIAKKNAEKWNVKQQEEGNAIKESPEDTEIVLDFEDGFKMVRLIGENAYKREGYLMNHCVGGYYGRDVKIYSLRDEKNIPHCTIEEDQQIKGKGNGDITPKYVDYIVRFLESTGMQIRDSEMSHLGYEIVKFGKYTKKKCYRDRYVRKGEKIEYVDNLKIFVDFTELKNYLGEGIVVFDGDITIEKKEKIQLGKLEQVSGYVDVYEGATFTAPKLTSSGSVYVYQGATFTAPKLTSSGSVYVREGATFTAPKLTSFGYVDVYEGATFTAPKLTSSGYVDVYEGATFTAPKLEQVSGYVDVHKNGKLFAPLLGYN